MLNVLAEGDKRGEGGDKCSDAADIYANEKISVILCELRKEDRRGYVTDKLAGDYAEKKGALLKKH